MHRIAATIAMFAFAQFVCAAPFQNGSFEAGFPVTSPEPCFVTLPIGSTNLTGWTVILGNVDWLAPACGVQSQTDGIASLDLVGDQMAGGIQQTFDTEPGYVYEVRFDLNGNFGGPPVIKPLRVTVAGVVQNYTFDTTGENPGNAASFWTTKFFTFVATGDSETITFVSDTVGQGVNAGAIIDNVRITSGSGNTPPSIVKSFGAASIPLNGSTSLSFTIRNPNDIPLTGVGFTDALPSGLVVSTPNGLTGSCGGGSIVATAGSASVSLTGAALSAGQSCTFGVNVTGTTPGPKDNTTSAVISQQTGPGNTASASVTVVVTVVPPTIAKFFGAASIPLNGSTSLSFTISNPNDSSVLTGIGFTDPLPAGLVVSNPNGLTGSCGGGTITATAGLGSISLTGATLNADESCTFSVNVTAFTAGTKTNTTGAVTSVEGGTGGTASASSTVAAPPPPPPPPPCVSPTLTSAAPLTGTVGVAYLFAVTATGDPPLTLTVTGLPAGLAFVSASNTIAGKPVAAGNSPLRIVAHSDCSPDAVQTPVLTILRSPTALSLAASPNPAIFSQTVTATLRATGGPTVPQGTVLLCVHDASAFCGAPFGAVPPGTPAGSIRTPLSATLDANGQALFSLSTLTIDNYLLEASYDGDAAHDGASAGPIDEFVIKGVLLAPPAVALRAPERVSSGGTVPIQVAVSAVTPAPMPTGEVRLYVDAVVVGSATLDAAGTAQFGAAAPAAGTLQIYAEYAGNTLFPSATSPAVSVVVAADPSATPIPATSDLGLAALVFGILAVAFLGRRSGRR
jgi:choice-of-anchor C domain-containing protein